MVSSVTLGSFFQTSSGKTVLGGTGGSGLDTQSLVKALTDAKSIPITQNQDKITLNDKQATALGTFQQLMSTFQSASDALRNPPGVGNAADNAFKFTTASILGGGSTYLDVTTSPGAALQSYNISAISQLATHGTQGTGTFTIDSSEESIVSEDPIEGTAYQFKPGTITVNGQDITLNEGDSLDSVAATFNAVSDDTGISATVIQLQSGQYRLSFTSAETGVDGSFDLSDIATVSSDADGVLSNIGLTLHQTTGTFSIADADTSVVTAGATPGFFKDGTVTVNGQAIVLQAGDTLNIVALKFNSANTGISAHVLKVATGQYKLAFTADPGTADFDLTAPGTSTDPDGVLASLSLPAPTAAAAVTAGTDAHFKINGIDIVRSSNTVSDVVNGVTFDLLQTTPDNVTNYAVNVKADTTTIQNAIVNFVKSYNAIKTFAAQQTQQNGDGTYAETAILANDSTFRAAMASLNSQIISEVSGLSGTVKSLADVGISLTTQPATSTTPEVPNILNVDDGKLASALATQLTAVKNLFGFNLNSNNPNLTVFSHTNALSISSFTLHITPPVGLTPGTYTASYTSSSGAPASVTLTATPLSGSVAGYLLKGPAGSVLDGLQLIYVGNSAATIDVTATQGVADRIYNSSDAVLESNTGTVAVALQSLKDSDTRLNEDISRVKLQVEQYQTFLLKQFSALEQAISKVNTLLQSLSANANAALAASGN